MKRGAQLARLLEAHVIEPETGSPYIRASPLFANGNQLVKDADPLSPRSLMVTTSVLALPAYSGRDWSATFRDGIADWARPLRMPPAFIDFVA